MTTALDSSASVASIPSPHSFATTIVCARRSSLPPQSVRQPRNRERRRLAARDAINHHHIRCGGTADSRMVFETE